MGGPYEPRIAIVGAGPGGLTLALLLHKRGITPTVFDLRPKPTKDDLSQPTGMLDLHEESGLAAIRDCGLMDQFLPLTGECAESMLITDASGEYLYTEPPGTGRPEISRNNLMGLILSALPDDAVRWGTKVIGAIAAAGDDGATTLDLGPDRGTAEFDFVVGADGAWSRVRPLVTDARPRDVGRRYATLVIRDIAGRHPQLASYIGAGTLLALGDGLGIATQRSSNNSAWFYIVVPPETIPADAAAATAAANGNDVPLSPLALKAALLDVDRGVPNFAAWGPRLKELIATACDDAANDAANATGAPHTIPLKTHAMLPADICWAPRPGVTLIGDAAHLMMPVGEGVNMAMWDALDLSRALASAVAVAAGRTDEDDDDTAAAFRAALAPLIRDFEAGMFERSREKAQESWEMFEMMYLARDGAEKLAALMARFREEGPPPA